MDIRDEYDRLKQHMATPEGFASLERACFRGLGYIEDAHGTWYETMAKPTEVTAIAIDTRTWKYGRSTLGEPHCRALERLAGELNDWDVLDLHNQHVVRVYLIEFLGWKYPAAILPFEMERDVALKVEDMLLEQEIGLPLTAILKRWVT